MITYEEVSKSLHRLTDHIRTDLISVGLRAFNALTEEERIKIASDDQPMRLAKVLIQSIAASVIDDYNHEAISKQVSSAKRILNKRVW